MIVWLVLPLVLNWALAVILAPLDGRRRWVGWTAIAGLVASSAASLGLAATVLTSGPVSMVAGGWPVGIGIALRADALSVIFAALANVLLLVTLLYEQLGRVEERAFPSLVLFLAAGLTGLFLTGDAFNFYVFFEVSMAASFVIATYGYKPRELRDAMLFAVVNLVGSGLFLAAVVGLYHVTGTLDMRGIAAWVDTVEPNTLILIATLAFVAFGIKLGLFPFHFWLPPVYRGVRPAVAAILSGVLANIGSYGLLRFGGSVMRRELELAASVLLVLGVASVLYGALLAVSRRSERDVLAYSSISQAGYILIALSVGGPVGYAAAILYAVLNAVNKTLLFLATGLRGWLVGAAFVIGAFSVAGVPPAAGFFGKLALFQTVFEAGSLPLVVALFLGSLLGFVYMFKIYQEHYWATGEGQAASALPLRLLVLGLSGALLVAGLWPEALLAISQQAGQALHGALP